MQYEGGITRTSFENALTDSNLQVTRLMQIALMTGVSIYALAVFILYLQNQDARASQAAIDTVSTLTIVHMVFFFGALLGSQYLPILLFSPQAMAKFPGADDPKSTAQRCAAQQRTAIIARLAVLEGAAFFGLAVCTIGAINGVLQVAPYYWINLLSAVVLLVYGVATFPSRERLVEWFEKSFNA